jgi:ABC-type multidrug transport system ATPase subunit
VLGLLGLNGAGKSTRMRILVMSIDRDEGMVTWNGVDIAKHPDDLRQVVGYLPQDFKKTFNNQKRRLPCSKNISL